jgi:hypothetical protein
MEEDIMTHKAITKKEFLDYVKSFNKEPYKYTEDEIYKIGIAHKKIMPASDKSWQEVADLVGWIGTANSLRCYILHKQNKDDVLTYTPTIEENSEEAKAAKELVKKKTELFREKQQVRDEWSTLRREMRDEARVDTFKSLLQESVSKLNSLPKIEYTPSTTNLDNEAVLMLSDLHIGTLCKNFYNTYDSKVALLRVKKLVSNTIDYCQENHVGVLNVVNLGDLIAGIIHVTIRLGQEFDVVDQVMTAAEYVSDALNDLQAAAPKVIYRSVTDNHSRIIADKDESIEKEQFSKLIDWFIETRLKDTKIVFAHDNLDDSIGQFNLLNGKKVIFVHGHLDNANQTFQNMVGATKQYVDYILLAHYHCEKVKSFQGSKVYVNGSIVGTEDYALSKRLFTAPAQTLLIFDYKRNNVLDFSVDLSL